LIRLGNFQTEQRFRIALGKGCGYQWGGRKIKFAFSGDSRLIRPIVCFGGTYTMSCISTIAPLDISSKVLLNSKQNYHGDV